MKKIFKNQLFNFIYIKHLMKILKYEKEKCRKKKKFFKFKK